MGERPHPNPLPEERELSLTPTLTLPLRGGNRFEPYFHNNDGPHLERRVKARLPCVSWFRLTLSRYANTVKVSSDSKSVKA